jgi:hypothetical protein
MSTEHCITNVTICPKDDTVPEFHTAISAWDYAEKHNFKTQLGTEMPFDECVKFARWCMGRRCEKNIQVYYPTK